MNTAVLISIAPLERIQIKNPDLDGSRGLNRAPANPSEPVVNTDIEAARLFLSTHEATPTTHRNYTKEIERLILWAVNVKHKPFSSLSFTDVGEYIEFLASPPVETWCSKRKHPRESAEWRPFVATLVPPKKEGDKAELVAGLSTSSRLTAMASLSAFFSWLVDYGYLIKNPMRQLKTKRKAVRGESPISSKPKVERYLDEESWAAFQDAIEMLPKKSKEDLDKYERAKFISALMLFLAPRASELASSRMNNFSSDDGKHWWWNIVGKGSKDGKVPVVDDMLKALVGYRKYLGLTPLPLENDDTPLLRSLKKGEPITDRQLNYILDDLFEVAATLLEQKAAELPTSDVLGKAAFETRAAKIRKASSHWGRHTSITYQVRSGIEKDVVRLNARHSNSSITEHYTHEEDEHRHKESQKLHS